MKVLTLQILAGLLVYASGPVHAEQLPSDEAKTPSKTASPDSQSALLDKMLVVGNSAGILKATGSAQYISAEEIRERNYDDINQVMRSVPGVYLRQEDGYGLFANISLRGVDTTRSAKITMMEDGVLTAPAPYSAPAAYYTPAVGRMSGLEILKGSSQVRYGPQTTGGVINYLSTKIPRGREFFLRTSYGSFADLRVHLYYGDTVSTKQGQIGYLLEGVFRDTDGFKTTDSTPDFNNGDQTGFKRSEPLIKLFWEADTEVYQRLEFKHGRSTLDGDVTYLGLSETDFKNDPYRRYASTRFDNIDSEENRSYLRYSISPLDKLDFITTLYRSTFSRNWYKLKDIRDVGGIAGNNYSLSSALALNGEGLDCLRGEQACTLRVRANNRDYKNTGIDLNGFYRFESMNASHEIAAGIRFNKDQVIRFQWDDKYRQTDIGTISEMISGVPGAAGDRLQETDALAVYLQDTIEFGSWSLVPGIRIERLNQVYIENYASEQPDPVRRNQLNLWAGSFGVNYSINDQWVAFGSLNRGFSPPNPKSAFEGTKEETSQAYETGFRYQDNERYFAMESTLFFTDFNNLIVVDNIGGAGSGESGNFGKVRSYGVEFSANYDAGMARSWVVSNPWVLTATYTNARQQNAAASEDPESIFSFGSIGNKVPYIPDLLLNLQTGIHGQNWGGTLSGSYVSESFTSASNTREQVNGNGDPDSRFGVTDSYFLLDASVYYRLNYTVQVFAGVQNLTDTSAVVSRQPEGPRPGISRYVYLGFELSM
ncbi:MAG: TonB-dependent receptor [Xanthomonadales bacterium]|nr:TonB-dependent receptor [Xanthomonadales bacterium]